MGLRKSEKYEKYEPLQFIAMLIALAALGTALKVPGFAAALPFALLPATVCAGAAAYLHSKLPKNRKRSILSRSHPVSFFVVLLLGNALAFLEFAIKFRQR